MAGVFVKYLATTICFAAGAKEPARVWLPDARSARRGKRLRSVLVNNAVVGAGAKRETGRPDLTR